MMIRPLFLYKNKKINAKSVKKSLTDGGFQVQEYRASQMLLTDCEVLYGQTLVRSYLEDKVTTVFDEFDRAQPEVQEFLLKKWNLGRVILSVRG